MDAPCSATRGCWRDAFAPPKAGLRIPLDSVHHRAHLRKGGSQSVSRLKIRGSPNSADAGHAENWRPVTLEAHRGDRKWAFFWVGTVPASEVGDGINIS